MARDRSAAETLARRYVWWQAAELSEPSKLLCQFLRMGTTEDYLTGIALWGEDAFREALRTSLPGAIDDRSWAFWHRYYGMEIPSPRRREF